MGFRYGSYTKSKANQQAQYALAEAQGKNYEGCGEINRPVDHTLTHETRPLPAWMTDPSLLPKKPPGRSP
jgi:hypothetical protein